jgi:hypothetical protein
MEKHKVLELVELLRKNKMSDHKIVELLSSIIQEQIMYGGDLHAKIVYYSEKAIKDSLRFI